MADRRTEESGATRRGPDDLTERINRAYGSGEPVRRDGPETTTGTGARPSSQTGQPARTAGSDSPAAATTPKAVKRVRKAHLRVPHVDPWAVMKTSFLFSVAIGIVTVVAVAVVWAVLGAAGIWESIDTTVADVVGDTGEDFRIEDYLGMSRVMGFTMIVAVVDVVLVTVIGTLGAFLYNLAAALLGGVEVVLAEEDR